MHNLTAQELKEKNQRKEINIQEKAVSEQIQKLVHAKGVSFPQGYDPQKALTNAMLVIKQDAKLSACTPVSIGQSVLNMITMGLDLASKQAYLIPYGGKAQLSISYFGTQTLLRRIPGIIDIYANAIHEGDEFEDGYDEEQNTVISKHETNWQNKDKPVTGSYCIIKLDKEVFGKDEYVEIMTIGQIKKAWEQGSMKGNSGAHKNFADQMAKKTVINRASKNFINTLTDSEFTPLVNSFNETIQGEHEVVKNNADQEKIPQNLTEEEPEEINTPEETTEQVEDSLDFDM